MQSHTTHMLVGCWNASIKLLLDILSKTTKQNVKDWDICLPFVLFVHRSSHQTSMGESPFYLLYCRYPRLTIEAVLCPQLCYALQLF